MRALMSRVASVVMGSLLVTAPITSRVAMAQDKVASLTGVVRDQEGRALEGVTVELLGTTLSATTAESGAFRFDAVRPGRYWIVARRIGFAPIRLTATLAADERREFPLELERVPQRLSELTVLAHGGMSSHRYQDFLLRSRFAFGTFLTRDDLAQAGGYDLVSVVQRYLPGKTRYTLERRAGDGGYLGGRLYRRLGSGTWYARDELGLFHPVGRSLLDVDHHPNCTPAISVNGSAPWTGVSLVDFQLDKVAAVEIYRRGSWVPAGLAGQDGSRCGLVVVWTK